MSAPVSLSPSLKPIRVSSAFGIRREYPKGSGKWTPPHDGVDWATPVGLPLVSGISGTVALRAGGPSHIWGYYVHIICNCPLRHTQEFHILRELPSWLKEGDPVEPGTLIGYTGKSGSLNGKPYDPHHHQGATVNGTHYNPLLIGWPSAAGGGSPFDNTEEDVLTPEQDALLKNIAAWLYAGGTDANKGYPGEPGTVLRYVHDTSDAIVRVENATKPATIVRSKDSRATILPADGKPVTLSKVQDDADTNSLLRTLVAGGIGGAPVVDVKALAAEIVSALGPVGASATKEEIAVAVADEIYRRGAE